MRDAVKALVSKRRWCVTGTPMHNGFEDFDGQMIFFGITNLDRNFWSNSAGFGNPSLYNRRRSRFAYRGYDDAMTGGKTLGIPASVAFLRRIVIR